MTIESKISKSGNHKDIPTPLYTLELEDLSDQGCSNVHGMHFITIHGLSDFVSSPPCGDELNANNQHILTLQNRRVVIAYCGERPTLKRRYCNTNRPRAQLHASFIIPLKVTWSHQPHSNIFTARTNKFHEPSQHYGHGHGHWHKVWGPNQVIYLNQTPKYVSVGWIGADVRTDNKKIRVQNKWDHMLKLSLIILNLISQLLHFIFT